MTFTRFRLLLIAGMVLLGPPAGAQIPPAVSAKHASAKERSLAEWLLRMHDASKHRAYVGTLVVSSGASMASSRVWHVCDGTQQMERVESLTGQPRSTFRHNEEVITFSPQSRIAVTEKRESLGLFPYLLKTPEVAIDQFYSARQLGSERVAGVEADIVQLAAKDKLRFGYRIWSEQSTGLVVKLQTLDETGQVLEQVAFSELQLDAPVSMEKLKRMMADTKGYRVESPALVKTTAEAQGWRLRRLVPGFRPMSCYLRPSVGHADAQAAAVQWVFSDGLASVSMFIEPHAPSRHGQEGVLAMGSTHTLMRRLDAHDGSWWLTLMGEVPVQTLQAFAQELERRP